jgi:hypothetical protein
MKFAPRFAVTLVGIAWREKESSRRVWRVLKQITLLELQDDGHTIVALFDLHAWDTPRAAERRSTRA